MWRGWAIRDRSYAGHSPRSCEEWVQVSSDDGGSWCGTNKLKRIKRLAIPPAWTEVWICPLAQGHLQAVGRDARKRKQYRYHSHWRTVRDASKFERMTDFGKALPKIRAQMKHDLAKSGLPKEKVLATIVWLLEETLIRVGNEEYAKQNNSFGLTMFWRNRHVEITGATVNFYFRGEKRNQAPDQR